MKIILLGPPGAGKGTQSELMRDALQIPHIATGDMLRAAIRRNDDFGKSIEAIVASGKYVADDTIIALVKQRIAEPDCNRGFILDGFPRTPVQAQALESAGVRIDYVVQIKVPDEQIIKRLSGRRVHMDSGRTYNIYFHPPKVEGKDDVTGEPLTQRPDDNEKTVKDRLRVYHEKTEPLIAWYKKRDDEQLTHLIEVDGTKDEQQVLKQILQKIEDKDKGAGKNKMFS